MISYILDNAGNPVPVDDVIHAAQWCRDNPEKTIVRQEYIGPWYVSTVFLHGIDHNWSGLGPPVLWETMVFWHGKTNPPGMFEGHEYQERYSSAAAALAGHIEVVEAVKQLPYAHMDDMRKENP